MSPEDFAASRPVVMLRRYADAGWPMDRLAELTCSRNLAEFGFPNGTRVYVSLTEGGLKVACVLVASQMGRIELPPAIQELDLPFADVKKILQEMSLL